LLEGRKTQTRRLLRNPENLPATPGSFRHNGWAFFKDYAGGIYSHPFKCPYGGPGDLLYVRETCFSGFDQENKIVTTFRADLHEAAAKEYTGMWRPSIFMTRQMSRLTLELTGVRVERLADISEEDKIAEGATDELPFGSIFERIHGPQVFTVNPWLWVLSFRVHQVNIDTFLKTREVA
jgi:hypothetical protein